MKKSILSIALLAFMAGTASISNGQNNDKKSVVASANIQQPQKDLVSEVQKFKKETELKIKSIDNNIGDLKVYFYKNKVKGKEAFQNNLNALEVKNDALKVKLAGDIKDQALLASLKLEFNSVVDELVKSLKDFRIKNK